MDWLYPARIVSLFALLVLQVMAAAAGVEGAVPRAQTPSSIAGAITGRITDATGAVLPGVTVAISGDSLMGTRTATSSSDGFYRFPSVPPGEYSLVFTRKSFTRATRDGIHVGPGFTATVDVMLSVEDFQTDITVPNGSTTIDRQSTAISANFTARELANLPTSRTIFAILSATPAVHVGRFEVGGTAGDASLYSAYGTSTANRPMIEGISMSGIFSTGLTLNFGSFDEVSVGTAAHGPEWPLPGVQMQIIVRSGGNHYHGSVYGDYENRALQSFNIDSDQIGRGAQGGAALPRREANRVWSDHDLNADIGGYMVRNRAWWYFSFREQNVAARVVNFPVRPLRTELVNYTAKVTYEFKPKNRLILFGHAGRNRQPNRLDPFGPAGSGLSAATAINESDESTSEQLAWGWVWKGEWNGVLGDNALVELRAGEFGADRPEKPNGTTARFEDVGTLVVRGGNRDWQQNLRRDEVLGSLSYFRDGPFGSHAFKAGGEIFRNMEMEIWRKGYAGDVLHVLKNGAASEVYLFQTPSRSANGLWTYGAYASDTWRVNPQFTVNLGLRFDRFRVFRPEQTRPAGRFNAQPQVFAAVVNVIDWNVIAPRIGVTHGLSRDGRSLVKFSYGSYSFAPGASFNANANTTPWTRYRWVDTDQDGEWQPGEETPLPDSRVRSGPDAIDPRLKLPRLDELGAWFERELAGNMALRTGIVWRGERQHFLRQDVAHPFDAYSAPVLIPDPGPDGRLGTSDDGPPLHGYELGRDASVEPVNVLRNLPHADSHYWTWDIAAKRRLSRHWSVVAAFDHVWNRDQTNAYFGQSLRQNPYPLTPNDLLNAGPDGRYEFRTWSARISGTYEGRWGLRLTPYVRHQSGQPFGRTFTTPLNYGNVVRILAEPIGTRRMDSVTIGDVRVEKGFRVSRSRRLAGFVDVFNLLNANPEQTTSWSSATFLRPLSIVPPRIARLGMKFDW